ncbi:MAG: sister chromatid cohesion protein PDS5 [Promethearchaeota archaeon]
MGFYDLPKKQRIKIMEKMKNNMLLDLKNKNSIKIEKYFSDKDTYIRQKAYLIIGKIYKEHSHLKKVIIEILNELFTSCNEKIRQTVVYACGEIGKIDPPEIMDLLERALNEDNKSVRNAVVGSLKRIGEKNPNFIFKIAKKYLHHPDPRIRKQIIHGLELHGRTHPEEILPFLKELQNDKDKNVIKMMIHVLGQISYKKGCLEKVVDNLSKWNNKNLVKKAIEEIIKVHDRYQKFSEKNAEEARMYIEKYFKNY